MKCKVPSAKLDRIEGALDALESELYDEATCYDRARELLEVATELLTGTLDLFYLTYSDFGEPQAEGSIWHQDGVSLTPYQPIGHKSRSYARFRIPLTSDRASVNGGFLTSEEESARTKLPLDLYWARLRLQQARDILGNELLWEYWEDRMKNTNGMTSTHVNLTKTVSFRVWITEEEIIEVFGITADQVTDQHFATLAHDKVFEFLAANDGMIYDLKWDIVSTDYEEVNR